jgi:hypothetical protein
MFADIPKKARKLAVAATRADAVFILLPPLILLIAAGTVAQRPMGLYAAQKMFFSSFVFWAGPVPLPGGYTLMSLLALSLLLKFLLFSEWSRRRAGVNLTHFGVLVLLFGGLLTAMNAKESFMVIPEDTESRYLYDYHQRTLYIFENDMLKRSIPFEDLNLRITKLPFEIKVQSTCENCNIVRRENEGLYIGMAKFMALKSQEPSKEPEADIPGLTFTIAGLHDQDGTYIAFEGMPEPIVLYAQEKEYKIIFGKQQNILPFALRLRDFKKETYPGTNKARGYSSDMVIVDNGIEWPAKIEMNKPLRYKGYTFYQSSFEQTDEMQATVLSVVRNKGRLFPYLGTLIMAAGLLLHLWVVMREKTA